MKKTFSFLSLAALSLAISGAALAGTTSIGFTSSTAVISYAFETAFPAPNNNYVLPPAFQNQINRFSTILPNNSIPSTSDVVFVEINLLDTATFTNIGAINNTTLLVTNATGVSLANATDNCSALNITAPLVSATQIRFRVQFQFSGLGQCTTTPRFIFVPPATVGVTDTAGNLATIGGAVRVQMRTLDGASVPTDTGGVDTVPYINSLQSTSATVFATSAIIDVGNPSAKKNFLPPNGATANTGGGVCLRYFPFLDRLGPSGTPFTPGGPTSTGFWTITLSGDMSGIASIVMATAGNSTSAVINGSTATITLNSTKSQNIGQTGACTGLSIPNQQIIINVDGTTALNTRTINVTSVTFTSSSGTGSKVTTNIGTTTVFTVWTYNGTILFAPFVNGNTTLFKSRAYVCIPQSSGTTGATIKILKQPVTGSSGTALATVTTTEPIATQGCLNFRVEDILTAGGIPLPYTTDGGNLAMEFTIIASKAVGVINVLNFAPSTGPESVATYPMFVEF